MANVVARLGAVAGLLDPILVVRMSFILATATVLVVYAIPAFRSRFLSYGSRSFSQSPTSGSEVPERARKASRQNETGPRGAPPSGTIFERVLNTLAEWQVPHNYFAQFYLLSLSAGTFWAHQYFTRGTVITHIGRAALARTSPNAMSKPQIMILWLLMSAQALRRLYECVVFRTASASKMWIGHYVLGLTFYAGMSVAIWIEGAAGLLSPASPPLLDRAGFTQLMRVSNIAALVLFVQASAGQHQAHKHLYKLRTGTTGEKKDPSSAYRLPTHPLFRTTLTPHYACECLIYFALCVIGAPAGRILNGTLMCALALVVVNLGVTADGTRTWYAQKFGEDAVQGRARMIPKVW